MKTGKLMAGVACLVMLSAAAGAQSLVNETRVIDTSDGLRINGELIASADLLAAARAEGTITLYTAVSEVVERQYANQFTADTGVNVEILRLVPSRLTERILSEFGAGRLAADVIRTTEPGLVNDLAAVGVFAEYRVPFEETLYEDAKASPEGLFYLWSSPAYSIGYNTALISPADAPTSWADLLDPRFQGRLGTVQTGAGGSMTALTRFMFDVLGQDFLEGFAAQNPRIFDSSARLVDSVARGELAIGPMPPSRVAALVEQGAPLSFILPEEGMVVWPSYIGLSSAARNVNAAQLYINWVMSLYGQEITVALGDYAVHPDAGTPLLMGIQLPSFEDVHKYNVEDTIANQASDAETWYAIFGYSPQ